MVTSSSRTWRFRATMEARRGLGNGKMRVGGCPSTAFFRGWVAERGWDVTTRHVNRERVMKRSTSRILTTHTGSLPRPADLVAALNAQELGEAHDAAALDARVRRAVAEIVQKQADTGIDVVDDGEHSKVNWMAYARARLSGLEEIEAPPDFRGPTRDSKEFAAAYEDMKVMLAGRSGALV